MKNNYLKIEKLALIFSLSSLIFFSCDSPVGTQKELLKGEVSMRKSKDEEYPKASEVINNWPEKQKTTAQFLIAKYGEPKEVTPTKLLWENNGMWKKTVVYKEEVKHNFPMPHTDFLEQTIDYKVPTHKFDELAMYDGSVILERTKGTMAARCDKEEMNILAINLANDIVMGKMTVSRAREFYTKAAMDFTKGDKSSYTEKLQFTVAKEGTQDPDKPVIDMMIDASRNTGKEKNTDMSKKQRY